MLVAEEPPERRDSSIRLLKVGEVAENLALSVATVRRLVRSGQLASIRIGGSVRFRLEDVSGLIERQATEGEEPAPTPALRDHADAGGGHGAG
jgi:excisionase family DNA binding protein